MSDHISRKAAIEAFENADADVVEDHGGVMEALRRRVPESPYPDGDEGILACPSCGSGEYLYNEDGNRCHFCGQCGQAIGWTLHYDEGKADS